MASTVEMFKALADEQRVKILEILCYGEQCANEILQELSIGQPTLSHHMKILCESGMVNARRSGKNTYYSIDYDAGAALKSAVEDLTRVRRRRSNTLSEVLL